MAHKLVVSIRNITDEQWQFIAKTAEELNWTAEFYENIEDALAASKDAEAVFADTPEFVRYAPVLKWMTSPSAGVNHFTRSEDFMKSGVMLSNSSGAYGLTISEHIVMAILTMLRRLPEYQAVIADRQWTRNLTIKSIKNSRITLLGTGDIGCETAKKLRGFEPAKITGVNTSGRAPNDTARDRTASAAGKADASASRDHTPEGKLFDDIRSIGELDEILKATDILVMSLPATDKTYHIMNETRLAGLPDGALIVNVGRGSCIDQTELIRQLKAGRLRAALDVFETEPIPEDSELWECPNLLITPHVAGDMYLPYTVERIVELFVEDFRRYAAGEKPARLVDLNKGY